MCGICHARVYNTNSSRPGVAVVRAGTLDRSDELDVAAHIWAKCRFPFKLSLSAFHAVTDWLSRRSEEHTSELQSL